MENVTNLTDSTMKIVLVFGVYVVDPTYIIVKYFMFLTEWKTSLLRYSNLLGCLMHCVNYFLV